VGKRLGRGKEVGPWQRGWAVAKRLGRDKEVGPWQRGWAVAQLVETLHYKQEGR